MRILTWKGAISIYAGAKDPEYVILLPYMIFRGFLIGAGKTSLSYIVQSAHQKRVRGEPNECYNLIASVSSLTAMGLLSTAVYFLVHNAMTNGLGYSWTWQILAGSMELSPEYKQWFSENREELTEGLGGDVVEKIVAADRSIPGSMAVYERAAREYGFPVSPTIRECLMESIDSVAGYPATTICRVMHRTAPGLIRFLRDVDNKARDMHGVFTKVSICQATNAYLYFYESDEARRNAPCEFNFTTVVL